MKELINLFNVCNLLFNNTFLFLEGCFTKLTVKIGNLDACIVLSYQLQKCFIG